MNKMWNITPDILKSSCGIFLLYGTQKYANRKIKKACYDIDIEECSGCCIPVSQDGNTMTIVVYINSECEYDYKCTIYHEYVHLQKEIVKYIEHEENFYDELLPRMAEFLISGMIERIKKEKWKENIKSEQK